LAVRGMDKRPFRYAVRAIAGSLEARVVMWERKPARRVRASAIDRAPGYRLANIPQGE
jgi:hypothetical protein